MINIKKYKFIFLISVGLLFSEILSIQAAEKIPSDLLSAIVLKILNYDRSLDKRVDDEVVIAIIHPSNNKDKKSYADEIYVNINKLKTRASIREKKIDTVLLDVGMDSSFDAERFKKALMDKKVSVVLLVTEDKSDLKGLITVIRDLKINSICSDESRLSDGIAFAVGVKGDKPKLFVNLRAVKLEGSDYSSKLLSLCKRIK